MPFGETRATGNRANSVILCDSSTIPDGFHQVDVAVTTSGPTFYFDYAVYDPSPTVSLSDAVILVDNTDPGLDFAGSGWTRYANLWPMTRNEGDQITLHFYGQSTRGGECLFLMQKQGILSRS